MNNLSSILANISEKKKYKETNKKCMPSIIRLNKSYPAIIEDADYDENKQIVQLDLIIFNTAEGVKKTIWFSLSGSAAYYYNEFCRTIGCEGDYAEMLGKPLILHLEESLKNGKRYENVVADSFLQMEALKELLNEMQQKENEESKIFEDNRLHTQSSYTIGESELDDFDDL